MQAIPENLLLRILIELEEGCFFNQDPWAMEWTSKKRNKCGNDGVIEGEI